MTTAHPESLIALRQIAPSGAPDEGRHIGQNVLTKFEGGVVILDELEDVLTFLAK